MTTIREAQEADASALLTYLNEVGGETDYLSFGAGEFKLSLAEEQASIRSHREIANQLFLVATVDERIVGVLTFEGGSRRRNAHAGEFGITVLQAYWNRGIGGRLLRALIEWAESSGVVRKINLHVGTANRRANALYQKHGFDVEGTVSRDMLIDGTFFDAYLMGRPIDGRSA